MADIEKNGLDVTKYEVYATGWDVKSKKKVVFQATRLFRTGNRFRVTGVSPESGVNVSVFVSKAFILENFNIN